MSIYQDLINKKTKIAVVGLGYVGLPVAIEFAKIVNTIGFDLNEKRISELQNFIDINKETKSDEIKSA